MDGVGDILDSLFDFKAASGSEIINVPYPYFWRVVGGDTQNAYLGRFVGKNWEYTSVPNIAEHSSWKSFVVNGRFYWEKV